MNQQYPKAVLTWADDQLVVSGNHCRLIDSFSKKINSNLIPVWYCTLLRIVIRSFVIGGVA